MQKHLIIKLLNDEVFAEGEKCSIKHLRDGKILRERCINLIYFRLLKSYLRQFLAIINKKFSSSANHDGLQVSLLHSKINLDLSIYKTGFLRNRLERLLLIIEYATFQK